MVNPAKQKGAKAEREAAELLSRLTGFPVRRALGEGRRDDCGDLYGLPATCIQVANYADINRALLKLPDVEMQTRNAKAEWGALFCRRVGGKWIVVLTPEMFVKLWEKAWNS